MFRTRLNTKRERRVREIKEEDYNDFDKVFIGTLNANLNLFLKKNGRVHRIFVNSRNRANISTRHRGQMQC